MLTNIGSDRVRSVRALARRAVREREALFLVEGPQAVREIVVHRPDAVKDVYVDTSAGTRHTAVLDAGRANGLSIREVTPEVLAAMCDTLVPQGIVAVCRPIDVDLDQVLERRPRLLLILTNVRDPGNAGTVIRSADAAGADAVLVSDSSVDIYNPKVVRSTAGSLFHLPIVTGRSIPVLLDRVRACGLALLAADGSGESLLPETDLSAPHAWVMGNEAWGLQPGVREACDAVVRVPIYGLAESLNLAMAATVCLYASAGVQRNDPSSG
jgi:TrmH family RNA methyltransferase